jgi:hypothetical protein
MRGEMVRDKDFFNNITGNFKTTWLQNGLREESWRERVFFFN